MALRLAISPPISRPKPPKARSASTNGSATGGRAVLASQGLHAGLHDRARLHGEDQARVRQAQREDHRPLGRPRRDHQRWANDIKETQGARGELSDDRRPRPQGRQALRHVPAECRRTSDGRTAADNATVRNVFIIGPDKKIKLMLIYPMTTGRNFDEMLRVHRYAAAHREAQGRDAGQLEAGRRRDHRRLGLRRRRQENLPAGLEGAEALHPHRAAAALRICTFHKSSLCRARDHSVILCVEPGKG